MRQTIQVEHHHGRLLRRMLEGTLLGGLLLSPTVKAAEVQMGSVSSQLPAQGGLGLWSQTGQVSGLSLGVEQAVKVGAPLSLAGSYTLLSTQRTVYEPNYLSAELHLHQLRVGAVLSQPLGRMLSVGVGAHLLGTVGFGELRDGYSGQTLLDPADPEGEAAVYTVEPQSLLGFSGGGALTARVALSWKLGGRRGGEKWSRWLRERRRRSHQRLHLRQRLRQR